MRFIATSIIILALSAGLAVAQQSFEKPALGMGSKTIESCRADTQKYCTRAPEAVVKECLVKYWTSISSDCQDALGKPFDGAKRGE